MRWQEGGESENVEDQRGLPVGMAMGGAGTIIVVVHRPALGQESAGPASAGAEPAAPPGVRAAAG